MLTDCHMHSNYSDGQNTVEEMIEAAIHFGHSAIAITDHVWRTTAWVPAYVAHLHELRDRFQDKISILIGIEAKVLDLKGDIDAHESFDHQVDLILGSMHGIPNQSGFYSPPPGNIDAPEQIFHHWFTAFCSLLRNPRVDIIAHPLAELQAFGIHLSTVQKQEILEQMRQSQKIVEINVRHQAPDVEMMEMLCGSDIPVTVSSDAHSVGDLYRYGKEIQRLLQRKGLNLVDMQQYVTRRPTTRNTVKEDE